MLRIVGFQLILLLFPMQFQIIYFSHKSPRVLFFLLAVYFSLMTFSCQRQTNRFQYRIACIPVLSSERWLNMTIADGIIQYLKASDARECLIYPLDWSFDAIDMDSILDFTYLQDYGKRIKLDVILISRVLSNNENRCQTEITWYDLKQNITISKLQDTLTYRTPNPFFKRIGSKTLELVNVRSDNVKYFSFLPVNLWKDYGSARICQLVQGDMDTAEHNLRLAELKDTTQIILYNALANVLLTKSILKQQKGQYVEDLYFEVEKILYHSIHLDSTHSTAFRLLGQLYIQREWWNKAEQFLRNGFERDPNDPRLYLSLSHLHPSRYRSMGLGSRVNLFRHALYLNPGFELAWIALGDAYYFQNKPEKAIATYKQLLAINPRSIDGLLALGKLYVVQNDIVQIIHTYEKVLKIDPDYADAYYNLGIAYLNDKKEVEAIRFFEKAIELTNHPDSYFYLGVIFKNRGDYRKAVDYLRKRINHRTGPEDAFAEQARKLLYDILQTQSETP